MLMMLARLRFGSEELQLMLMMLARLRFGSKTQPGQHHEHQLQLFGTKTQPGQHHEHELHSSSEPKRSQASIMSISCTALRNQNATRPASGASAAQLFVFKKQPGQHHEHQLHSSSDSKCKRASIMSISCTALRNQNAGRPAS